jgi:hypothetical protein
MPCEPAPPCEPSFPLFCEPLPSTTDARRLVVEDAASCQKAINTPLEPSVLTNTSAGVIEWEGGSTGSVLQITPSNTLDFVNGSSIEPFQLPSLQTHTPDNVPNVVVMLADGTIKKWDPTNVGNNFLAYWDGSDWRINTLNNLLPSGNGVLIRDSGGNLSVATSGPSGAILQMVGSNIQFVAAASNQLPGGHIYGMVISNNVADANNDLDISIGECRSSNNTTDLLLTSAITKRSDAPWAAGTNQGGMDTGVKPNNGTLHVFIISDGANVDAIFSQSSVSPTLPGGYTSFRRIGAVTTDASGNIRAFVQFGDRFLYRTLVKDVVNGSANTGGTLVTLTVPAGIRVYPLMHVGTGLAEVYVAIYDPTTTYAATNNPSYLNSIATSYVGQGFFGATAVAMFQNVECLTNTSRQVGIDVSVNITTLYVDTHGYIDNRERLQP